MVTVIDGMAKPAACGLPESKLRCASSSDLPVPAKIASAALPLMLAATMPEPASAVSKVIGTVCPAFGDRGPVTTSSALAPRCRAAIAL